MKHYKATLLRSDGVMLTWFTVAYSIENAEERCSQLVGYGETLTIEEI